MIAVVSGMIATCPVGGVVWDYGQYALGLEQLGFDVYYLEDTGQSTYDAAANTYSADCSYGVAFLERSLADLSPALGTRWHFRHFDDTTYGLSSEELLDVIERADVFVNVSGVCQLRDEYSRARNKLFLDTDPGSNHFHYIPLWDARGPYDGQRSFREHDAFFTYALNIGAPDCILPDHGISWRPTRPPVVLDEWRPGGNGSRWTTVLSWDSYRGPIEWQGAVYGSKQPEFERIETLPQDVSVELEVAAGGRAAPKEHWRTLGWHVSDSVSVSRTSEDYRGYIEGSRGEFSVAKNVYVAPRTGWFSCRTTCYLAAGRPAVVQDTGFSAHIPVGDGLLAFDDLASAAAGIVQVESDVEHHRRAAREVAETCFDSRMVLTQLLEDAGI